MFIQDSFFSCIELLSMMVLISMLTQVQNKHLQSSSTLDSLFSSIKLLSTRVLTTVLDTKDLHILAWYLYHRRPFRGIEPGIFRF